MIQLTNIFEMGWNHQLEDHLEMGITPVRGIMNYGY